MRSLQLDINLIQRHIEALEHIAHRKPEADAAVVAKEVAEGMRAIAAALEKIEWNMQSPTASHFSAR